MPTKLAALLFSVQRQEVLIPRLNTFLAKEAKEIEAGTRSRAAGVIRDAQLTVNCFKTRMAEYNHDAEDETKDYFHPSQIGQCLRRLFFQQVGAPDNGTAVGQEMLRQHLVFEIGTYAHVMLQNLISRAGMLVRREVPVRNDKKKIIGHADGILKLGEERALLEIKTINERGFSKLIEPKPEHVEQANIYMDELKLPAAVFIYFDKNGAQLKEFRVKYDPRLQKNRIDPRIEHFHAALKKRKMPDREGSNPMKFPCSYCEFSGLCFSSSELKTFLTKNKITGSV